jgi:hypothetical protein
MMMMMMMMMMMIIIIIPSLQSWDRGKPASVTSCDVRWATFVSDELPRRTAGQIMTFHRLSNEAVGYLLNACM